MKNFPTHWLESKQLEVRWLCYMTTKRHTNYGDIHMNGWWKFSWKKAPLAPDKTFPFNVSFIRPWKFFLLSFTRLLIFICRFSLTLITKYIVSNNREHETSRWTRGKRQNVHQVGEKRKMLTFRSCYGFPLFKGLWGFVR